MYALKTHKKKPVMDEGGSPFVVPTWKVQELVAKDIREGLMEIEWPRTGPRQELQAAGRPDKSTSSRRAPISRRQKLHPVGVIWKKLAVIASHSCPTNTNSRPKSTSYEDSSGRRRTPSAPPTAGLSGRDSPDLAQKRCVAARLSPSTTLPKLVGARNPYDVFTNFLSGVLNAMRRSEECLLLQLKCDLLETPEIAKILCNVYKGSCIAKYPLKQLFIIDLPC
ncbi:hypothetical protein GEV33_015365 [Tenebrio molitor]|uniref:Uncharacterized protein n=1 Tax=Tenebrio molitor TaxID=7067 RepID=A0A8J6LB82_TENMO|nr:hypothetical protein GEV33_015370 [Tenebrio molitor]KAH0807426.1 hypothetical protein GEV33_015365 [Tenebrio molitor]